ncbi:MAG: AAA family ATPase [Oscillospiraceae bacterium]|nr:AAA family ATPase [Oscillospiraceae bacterium]
MTDFEKKIYEVIAESNGIRAAEIAGILEAEKKEVSTALAKSAALKALVTQGSDYRWRLTSAVKAQAEEKSTPKPDEDLRRLCNYYLQCLSLEANCSVSQFLYSRYDYPYIVLNGLGIDAEKDPSAISFLSKVEASRESRAYLGYPVRIYTIYGKGGVPYKRIAPVFLFPVDYASGVIQTSWVPTINMDVLKGYCVGGAETVVSELIQLESELGMDDPDTDVAVDELVLRLRQIRDWEWKEAIDPYHIPPAEDITGFSDGIYNRPVVIEGTKTNYTDGLESELMALAAMPEDKYRGTALHAWVKDQISVAPSEPLTRNLLEVLPLNTEQAQAVETALNSDLTVVTGPPGTGKSQVVTDLLANIAWNGKSALFSSRNNKAVDVVDMRVNSLSDRPSLLRIGSTKYASRLAEIMDGLLNTPATKDNRAELQRLQQKYDALIAEEAELKEEKERLVLQRNRLDELEQEYCRVRDVIGDNLFRLEGCDAGQISKCAKAYRQAADMARKENNSFFSKLFWSWVEPKRLGDLEAAAKQYESLADRYGLVLPDNSHSAKNTEEILRSADSFEAAVPIALEYRSALESARGSVPPESVDRKLSDIKMTRSEISQKLWDNWLCSKRVAFSPEERKEMNNFIVEMRLSDDMSMADNSDLRSRHSRMIQLMTRYLQCWAVTSLSAKSRIPFEAGLFDYVIIDEASQCDIASIIPLLYRAKRAIIIGDRQQLQHISQLTNKQDRALIRKYHVDFMWSYHANSVYSLAAAKVQPEHIIQLRDHFRSCAEIIEFSNREFYGGTLRVATRYDRLKPPPGEKPGIRWINVQGRTVRPRSGSAYNQEEIIPIINELKRLVNIGYTGTIGVVTPFQLQAQRINRALEREPELKSKLESSNAFIASTVHGFQGDERDLMIFSCVVTASAESGTVNFLKNTGNLFNVAITRARAVLVVVGDYRYCKGCEISYLQKFANYYSQLVKGQGVYPPPEEPEYPPDYPEALCSSDVSEWEKILYAALFDAGVKTRPQYGADRYRLDLAVLLPNGRQLDVEVDGEMYHRSWNGELSYRDQLRNQRLFELGWDVKRFWVYQIRDDLDWCVQRVKDWVAEAGQDESAG